MLASIETRGSQGVIIGRFMPPHNGHRFLIDFARNYADHLTILLCSFQSEPIAGEMRYRWLCELFPSVRIVHITERNPDAARDRPNATHIWADTIRTHVAGDIDMLFASEDYGRTLAELIGARYIAVDPLRHLVPISASELRRDPWTHWRHLPSIVRPYFVRRVVVATPPPAELPTSAERRHGSQIVQRLTEHFRTPFTIDYLAYWQQKGHLSDRGAEQLADPSDILRAQQASEEALARHANRVLFCSSDPIRLAAWWSMHFGAPPALIEQHIARQHYDLYIAETTSELGRRCAAMARRRGLRLLEIDSNLQQALAVAIDAVEALMRHQSGQSG